MGPKDFIRGKMNDNASLNNFQFHRYIQEVYNLFGEDHTYIMIYEHFRKNFSEEMLKLLNYMGEPEVPKYKNVGSNKSYGTKQLAIARRLNRLFKTSANPEGKLRYINVPIVGKVSPRRLLQNDFSFKLHYKRYELPGYLQKSLRNRYLEGNKIVVDRFLPHLPER